MKVCYSVWYCAIVYGDELHTSIHFQTPRDTLYDILTNTIVQYHTIHYYTLHTT